MDKKVFAFFDVDGTIINVKSMMRFMYFYYMKSSCRPFYGKCRYIVFRLSLYLKEKCGVPREQLNALFYKRFRRMSLEKVSYIAKLWYRFDRKNNSNLMNNHVVEKLKQHQKNSIEIVFVSGSFFECLAELAKDLKVKTVLATQLEVENGSYTGNIAQQTIGKGKAVVIGKFLNSHKSVDKEACFAYGDHISDLNMFNFVGFPNIVRGDVHLERLAIKNNWPIVGCN